MGTRAYAFVCVYRCLCVIELAPAQTHSHTTGAQGEIRIHGASGGPSSIDFHCDTSHERRMIVKARRRRRRIKEEGEARRLFNKPG